MRNGLIFEGHTAIDSVMKPAFTCVSYRCVARFCCTSASSLWVSDNAEREKSMNVKRLYSPVGFYTERLFKASLIIMFRVIVPPPLFHGKVADEPEASVVFPIFYIYMY